MTARRKAVVPTPEDLAELLVSPDYDYPWMDVFEWGPMVLRPNRPWAYVTRLIERLNERMKVQHSLLPTRDLDRLDAALARAKAKLKRANSDDKWLQDVHELRRQGVKWLRVFALLREQPGFPWRTARSMERSYRRMKQKNPGRLIRG